MSVEVFEHFGANRIPLPNYRLALKKLLLDCLN